MGPRAKITAYSLGEEIGMTPKMASGWLSKFASWGYVERHGTCGVSDGKWIRLFILTEKGLTREEPSGRMRFVKGLR
jgi:hypothetical protein